MPFPKAIITKPFLVTDTELNDLGQNINLVGYDSFGKSIEGKTQHISPRLVNWVEPYLVSGIKKTLFYTEINSNLQVGDRVFIINGAYDNNSLIKIDKYKKGRDGYKVLKVENCKIVLDIDYTGVSPYKEDTLDNYIKVYYIGNEESFVHANRQITTRGGNFDYKFNYGQNNIAFIDKNYEEVKGWGLNAGVVDGPGFFVRDGREIWSNISDNLIYLGSFSVALSPTYKNNGKIIIQNGDFEYNGIQFKEGIAYKWEVGPTNSYWAPDVDYSTPIITKSNFRNGTFTGKFNNGLYGTQESKIEWSGKGTWNGGTVLNSVWKSGTMNSNISVTPTYRAGLDSSGYPFQKEYTANNGGYGFNYVIDSEIESSNIINGNFYNTVFNQHSSTFSVVENHVLSLTQSFDNNIVRAYFDLCKFENIQISGGELKNTRGVNSKFTNVKLVNSYVKNSVIKDSTYIGDGIIKILGYDEWNMSEYFNVASGTFSSIKDVNQKIYKFYISKESFKRIKNQDSFYIKGLNINDGTKKLLNFFDGKFRITSWTEFYDDYSTGPKSITGVDTYSLYKRGYECSAFLSTPEENSYIINSVEYQYFGLGPNDKVVGTYSKYYTGISDKNANSGYSIDIIVDRHDIVNKNSSMDSSSEWEGLNPKNYNYDSDVIPGTSSVPKKLGNIIDISGAYILDADFESGIIETSDWNSGNHINYNNDVVITPISNDGLYDLEIDKSKNIIVANTLRNDLYPENIGKETLAIGEIVFLNSVDYDTRGMVTAITILATGSSYSTTNPSNPAKLVNTTVLSITMSNSGTNYLTGSDLPTISDGFGTGLTVDIVSKPIGAVLSIAYSAPITNGGSYSMNFSTSNQSISTTGLVLNMDPEFSYPGSGTSWTDLVNLHSGSLNGFVYDSTNKAFSSLTSTYTTPRWISISNPIQFVDGNEYSMEFSVKLRPGAEGTYHSLCGNWGFDGWVGIEGSATSWKLFFRDGVIPSNLYTNSQVITNYDISQNWGIIGITVDSSRNIKFYLNGALIGITTPTLISTKLNMAKIGGGYSDSGRYYPFQGLISSTRVYNRLLSASEILLNYNLTKEKFGHGAYIQDSYGPIATSFSTDTSILPASYVTTIVTDTDGSVTGIVNATYSVFGPPQTAHASGAQGVGVIFANGPHFTGGGMTVNYTTNTQGAITNISINEYGNGYLPDQIFKVEGGNATFSITSVSNGEVISYSIKDKGEDYRVGEILQIQKPFDPNSLYNSGITASITITAITASYFDTKGLSLDILSTPLPEGKIIGITISNSGLYYTKGEIFTISGGNLDAIVRIESVTGSITRLGDSYKVVESNNGVVGLKEVATQSMISNLPDGGVFYTEGAKNRWGYINKAKFDRTKIKSGLLRRAYITKSLIRDINYNSTDKDFLNYNKVKNLLITDCLFSNNSNILSSATYLYSSMVGGSDLWNDGIVFKSTLNGMTFSKGTVKQSIWLDGNFTGGIFYDSKSFDAKPTEIRPNYLSNRVRSYFFTGEVGATLSNSRYSWQNGTFSNGEFYKSDWEKGTFENGLFYYSKFYGGTINNGIIGTKNVSAEDTRVYNGTINYATVNNAYVYSNDTSYTGMSSSSITWMNGVFNNGVFGSNNDVLIGTTVSEISYPATFSALPIKDYMITSHHLSVLNTDVILNELEIIGKINLKHTYIGDLIINLMAPNGKIINLKKRYSGGSSDNLIETTFSSDLTNPSLEISTTPHTGEFAFANVLNQGVYYKMNGTLLANLEYSAPVRSIPQVIDYASFPPSTTYEGDRYLVIATSSDPNWTATSNTDWIAFKNLVVKRKYDGTWLPDPVNLNGDSIYVKSRNEYLKYVSVSTTSFQFRRRVTTTTSEWVKSYHSNTTNPMELLNLNKTITGTWRLIVMDVAGADVGFVDDFTLGFKYKSNYVIKSFKNDAVWYNGVFNGGQFIDLGVWKNGVFNNGKFISTYGHSKSGNYLIPSKNQADYSWQGGEFNGGEFGNEKSSSNSTWFNGEFNNGVFKGKLWNNGVFTYGEFKGGSTASAVGGGIKGASASGFVDQFRDGYYGVWRSGIVSDKKDTFVTDKKLFTVPKRAVLPSIMDKKAIFTNILWLGGTFNHPSGEIKNSVWLDGLFQMGKFEHSSFNPYVKRYTDTQEFLKDDSCIWENGKLVESEFFFSKWNYGQFISGTAVGMIWKNGTANYMNAHNVFWENGTWRNGNWNGSSFEYSGQIFDGFIKEILNRGIEWSGTNSCHIWNIFETDVDKTNNLITSNVSDTFATDNVDDAGSSLPTLGTIPTYTLSTTAGTVIITYRIMADGGSRITQTGIVFSSAGEPGISLGGGTVIVDSGSAVKVFPTSLTTTTIAETPTGTSLITTSGTSVSVVGGYLVTITISGLTSGVEYKGLGYAVNTEGKSYTTGGSFTFQYVVKNIVNYTSPMGSQIGEMLPIAVVGSVLTNQTGYSAAIEKGIMYSTTDPDPLFAHAGCDTILDTSVGTNINATIPLTSLSPVTTYYIRTYTRNAAGYGYSAVNIMTTGVVDPTLSVSTSTPSSLSAIINTTGGSTSLRRGFIVWQSPPTTLLLVGGQLAHPDTYVPYGIANQGNYYRFNAADGVGNFSASLSGLLPNVSYRFIAFTYNSAIPGIYGWSQDLTANTFISAAVIPTVEIISNIPNSPQFSTDFVSGYETDRMNLTGNILSNGGTTLTEKGFVYTSNTGGVGSMLPFPDPTQTITNTTMSGKIVATLDNNTGQYSAVLTGLLPGKLYYYKPYVKNSIGVGIATGYTQFNTLSEINSFVLKPLSKSFYVDWNISSLITTNKNLGLPVNNFNIIYTSVADPSTLNWWPTYSGGPTNYEPSSSNNTSGLVTTGVRDGGGYPQYGPNISSNMLKPNTKYSVLVYVENYANYTSVANMWKSRRINYTYSTGKYTLVDTYLPTFNADRVSVNYKNTYFYPVFSTYGAYFGQGTDPIVEKGVQYGTDPLFTPSVWNFENSDGTNNTSLYAAQQSKYDNYGWETGRVYNPAITDMTTTTTSGYVGGFTMSFPFMDALQVPANPLVRGTRYYYRSYWRNDAGTSYGATGSLNILPTMTVSSMAFDVSGATKIKAVINLTNINVPILDYGLVWQEYSAFAPAVSPGVPHIPDTIIMASFYSKTTVTGNTPYNTTLITGWKTIDTASFIPGIDVNKTYYARAYVRIYTGQIVSNVAEVAILFSDEYTINNTGGTLTGYASYY